MTENNSRRALIPPQEETFMSMSVGADIQNQNDTQNTMQRPKKKKKKKVKKKLDGENSLLEDS